MEITSITPTGFKVLEALNTYRFLSIPQMLRLGVARDRGNLSKVLNGMISARKDDHGIPRPKEIGSLDFGSIPGIGRLARLYFLAPKGAEALDELPDRDGPPARPVKHAVRFRNDYFHRVNTVDFHIALAQFAVHDGHKIDLVRQYFTRRPKEGTAPPRPSTSIDLKPGYIDPDSLYRMTGPDGKERVLLVEIANGHKVDRVVKKLPLYAQALETRKINQALSYEKGIRVLWVFEHERTLELVQKQVGQDAWVCAYEQHFFFKTLAGCTPETLQTSWLRPALNAGAVSLF
jgi:hypothetical protein